MTPPTAQMQPAFKKFKGYSLEDKLIPEVSALQQSLFGISIAIELRDIPLKNGIANIRDCVEQYLASVEYDYTEQKNDGADYMFRITHPVGPLSLRVRLNNETLGKEVPSKDKPTYKNTMLFYVSADMGLSDLPEEIMREEIKDIQSYLTARKDDLIR